MIELYRPIDCSDCAEYEDALREMVVAHKIITVEPGLRPESLPPQTPLPAIKEDQTIISGPEAIQSYLKALARFVRDWQRFQGDACYVNDDGTTC